MPSPSSADRLEQRADQGLTPAQIDEDIRACIAAGEECRTRPATWLPDVNDGAARVAVSVHAVHVLDVGGYLHLRLHGDRLPFPSRRPHDCVRPTPPLEMSAARGDSISVTHRDCLGSDRRPGGRLKEGRVRGQLRATVRPLLSMPQVSQLPIGNRTLRLGFRILARQQVPSSTHQTTTMSLARACTSVKSPEPNRSTDGRCREHHSSSGHPRSGRT